MEEKLPIEGSLNFNGEPDFSIIDSRMDEGEALIGYIPCTLKATRGYIVATSNRLFYSGTSNPKGLHFEEFSYKEVSNLGFTLTWFTSGKIMISTQTRKIILSGCDPFDSDHFIGKVKERLIQIRREER